MSSANPNLYPHAFPKPLDEIQPNLVCELLT